jgi:hypothetical protein
MEKRRIVRELVGAELDSPWERVVDLDQSEL